MLGKVGKMMPLVEAVNFTRIPDKILTQPKANPNQAQPNPKQAQTEASPTQSKPKQSQAEPKANPSQTQTKANAKPNRA